MLQDRQKVGGVAALIEAATFIVGFALFALVLSDYTTDDPEPAESVAFLVDHQAAIYVFNLVIFIIFAIFLVVLALALHQRVKAGSPGLADTATVFGLVWAGLAFAAGMIAMVSIERIVDLADVDADQAESVWASIDSIQEGLGGGIEIVGALWVALVSWAAIRAGVLPLALNILGLVIGVAGIVTLAPALEMFGAVFGLGLIVWFVWVGIVLLRDDSDPGSAPAPAMGDRATTD